MQAQHRTRQILVELSYGAVLALAVGTATGTLAIGLVWLLASLNG